MAFGGALGVLGVPLPAVETGIALSGVILGLMVCFAAKPPLWVAAVIVGAFAVGSWPRWHHPQPTKIPPAGAGIIRMSGFPNSSSRGPGPCPSARREW